MGGYVFDDKPVRLLAWILTAFLPLLVLDVRDTERAFGVPVADYGRGVFTALLFLTSYYYAEVVNGDEADVLDVSALLLWLAFIL